ncbi:50S ribosomal protein L18 [Candidatus Pacearchaeota archaeon CG10_big_fil_rev_8_21_14_0_10_34_12]|nr:MAG: 50S ribosomal protein L18 [Candidatus Pacearchaeota archaeon CG10_big_fil_rev_8_21_14_0_10_34_12]
MRLPKKRRRENKTDYKKRMNLLKGESPRLVFRKTNKYLIVQYITNNETRDKVEIGVNSKTLLNYGWPKEFMGSLKTLPASYLTGFLMGKKILKEKKATPIVDFGMAKIIHKSKVFAFLKGFIDAGINIKQKKDTFPSQERIEGNHLKKDFSKIFIEIKEKIEKNA